MSATVLSTASPQRHQRRRFATVVTVFAVVVSLFALTAAPAGAAGSIVNPTPPGGGSGSGGSSTGSTSCNRVDWWPGGGVGTRNNGTVVAYPVYPACINWEWVQSYADCTIGYDVWRFYGTRENPTRSQTVSRLDQYDACADPAARVLVNSPHPDDAGIVAGAPFRYPWLGDTFTVLSKNSGRPVSITAKNGEPITTTNLPFGRKGEACSALSTPESTLGRYFYNSAGVKGADYDTPMGALLRQEFKTTWLKVAANWGTAWANTMINASMVSVRDPAGTGLDSVAGFFSWLNTDPKGEFIAYGDGVPCSSDLDFYTELPAGQTVPTAAQQKIAGSCAMEIRRTEQGFRNRYTGEMWWTDTFKYPMYYNAWDLKSPEQRQAQDPATVAYAVALYWEVATRTPEQNPDNAPPASGRLPAPVSYNPYLDSAGLAFYGADCSVTEGAIGGSSATTVEQTPFPASVNMNVSVPVGQVGGLLNPARITAQPVGLPSGFAVIQWDTTLNVTAPGGFPRGDWYGPASSAVPGATTFNFLRATDPGKPFSATVSGRVLLEGKEKVTTTIKRPCWVMSGEVSSDLGIGIGGTGMCTTTMDNVEVTVQKWVPVNVIYTVGGVSSPNGNFPVINATEVPKTTR